MRKPSLLRAGLKLVGVLAILAWSVLPIALIVMSSFKSDRDIFSLTSRFSFLPTLASYELLWSRWGDFFFGLWNSFLVTLGATVLAVTVSLLAGFAYSRHSSKALQASAFFLIFIRLIPPIVITLPLFPVVNWFGLNDTHLILIVLYATFFVSLGTIVMRTFIDQIPRELDEAAMIDGASQFQIIRRVIFPLAAQGMLAVAVFVIVYAWNEFLFAFIFTTTKAKTAPLVVAEMIGAVEGVEWGVLFAASTVQLLPVLAFVILMQKHLVAGLTAGAVKG
jgi:multiple sugar transport system permease protein